MTSTHRLTRATDARTLYLASTHPLRVTSTGEALVVACTDGPVQRLPIRLLHRVVSGPSTDWSGAALALCMQHGVTISWTGPGGEPAGHLWPQQPRPLELATLLHALAGSDHHWPEAYGNWLRCQRLQVLHLWRRQRAQAGQPVGVAEWQAAKQHLVYRNQVPEQLPQLLRGMAAALVVARLADGGLRAHYWACTGQPIALADDITCLVWAEMNLCAGPLAAAIDNPRVAATLFERWAGTCAGAVYQHLASLRAQALRQRNE